MHLNVLNAMYSKIKTTISWYKFLFLFRRFNPKVKIKQSKFYLLLKLEYNDNLLYNVERNNLRRFSHSANKHPYYIKIHFFLNLLSHAVVYKESSENYFYIHFLEFFSYIR